MKTASTRQLNQALRQIGIDTTTKTSLDSDHDQVCAKTAVWHAELAQSLQEQLDAKGIDAKYTVNKVFCEGYIILFTTRKRAK